MYKLNLQMFADDVDDDDEDFLEEDFELDTDPEDEDNPEENLGDMEEDEGDDAQDIDDDEDDDDGEPERLDKKTKSIIKHKKENRELRKRLEELEAKAQTDDLEKEKSQRILELAKEGKSTQEATKIAENEIEVKKLRLQLAKHEIGELEKKYPGISTYARQLAEDKTKLPEFSYEQLYVAKYAKSSAYDERTKLEQELLHKSKAARNKALDSSNAKQNKTVKLSREDENVYQILKKSKPNLTRKQYKQLAESSDLE